MKVRPIIRVAAALALLLLAGRAIAFAHAVVYPRSSTAGARERYTIRVPNERKVPTTRVEIRFPAGVRVSGFLEVPGWKLEVLRDTAQLITGAVWTGSLSPERFAEFTFAAMNPKDATAIIWPVIQTYADGELAEWTGPAGSNRPASSTTLAPAPVAGEVAASAAPPGGTTRYIAIAALVLSIISVGLALRPRAAR